MDNSFSVGPPSANALLLVYPGATLLRPGKMHRYRQDSGAVLTLRMAAHHGEFAFRAPHQPMQICGLGRYACGKATGCEPPAMVEALGIGFDYKREEAFAQSGYSLLYPLPVPYIRQSSHNIHTDHIY